MGTLKAEIIQGDRYASFADADTELFAFIDSYYNTQPLHSSLNYRIPSRFEADVALANLFTFGPNTGTISHHRITSACASTSAKGTRSSRPKASCRPKRSREVAGLVKPQRNRAS